MFFLRIRGGELSNRGSHWESAMCQPPSCLFQPPSRLGQALVEGSYCLRIRGHGGVLVWQATVSSDGTHTQWKKPSFPSRRKWAWSSPSRLWSGEFHPHTEIHSVFLTHSFPIIFLTHRSGFSFGFVHAASWKRGLKGTIYAVYVK